MMANFAKAIAVNDNKSIADSLDINSMGKLGSCMVGIKANMSAWDVLKLESLLKNE